MPSPIAHVALAVPARAVLGVESRGVRGLAVWGLLMFACVAPDMDIPIEWARTGDAFALHGSYSHSLLIAPVFGAVFAGAMRLVAPGARWWRALWVGTGLYALHVLMDLVTAGSRGVSLLWPVVPGRIGTPVGIFVGVEHSDWKRVDKHLLTIVTEGAFALVVWAVTRVVVRRRARRVGDA